MTRSESKLSVETLRSILKYNRNTGVFHWRIDRGGKAKAGTVAGTMSYGYVSIRINGVRYQAHRLAWLYVTGEWPSDTIDHKNGDKSCNRFSNLRDVDAAINSQNAHSIRSHKKSCSLLGAFFNKRVQRFVSYIGVNGKQKHLGYFDTAEEAHRAYVKAKRKLHKGCTL